MVKGTEKVSFFMLMEVCMMVSGTKIKCMAMVYKLLHFILGILYYASGNPAYDGQWVEDKFEGQGTLYNENPEMIYGEFNPEDFDTVAE